MGPCDGDNILSCKHWFNRGIATVTAVSLAIMRDGSSGGVIRMAAISEDGVDKHLILHEDITQFYRE